MTSISIVTPWLDHLELVADYFAAVEPVLHDGDELIVVDNASDPPLDFATIRLSKNRGFAGGSNFGMWSAYASLCDAVLFLNNDIRATRADWLTPIREALEPGVLVGARLRYDFHGDVDGQAYPYLDGWCLAGMLDDLLALGGFDEDLQEPAYFSDNLLCLRARAAGMRLRAVPTGLVHKENMTVAAGPREAIDSAFNVNRERFVERVRELVA